MGMKIEKGMDETGEGKGQGYQRDTGMEVTLA